MTESVRLRRQLEFLAEMDKLKHVLRMTSVIGESRRENSAEHSWHLGVMAALLAEYAPDEVDAARVTKMLLIHDVVEIDAGDTFCFDEAGHADKEDREQRGAVRLFGLLPEDQGEELRALWDEFEQGETRDARFAVALDRFQGLFQNYHNQGGTWRIHRISREKILQRMAPIEEGAPALWPVVLRVLAEVEAGGATVG